MWHVLFDVIGTNSIYARFFSTIPFPSTGIVASLPVQKLGMCGKV